MKKELDKRRFKTEALIFFSQLLLKMLVQLSQLFISRYNF